jgi:hypothetical protein
MCKGNRTFGWCNVPITKDEDNMYMYYQSSLGFQTIDREHLSLPLLVSAARRNRAWSADILDEELSKINKRQLSVLF